ncbi:MAG: hypothetical protein WDN03_01650 [Rhizomicrobium sp.]
MPFLLDIWHAVQTVVMASDWITLAIMVVVALGAGFLMHNMTSLVTTTFVALIAFGLAGYVRAITIGKQNPSAFATTDWQAFLNLPMRQFLPYVLVFLVAIAVAHALRAATVGRD